MKYLVLRRVADAFDDFVDIGAAPADDGRRGGGFRARTRSGRRGDIEATEPAELPFTAKAEVLEDDQVNDALAEEDVEGVIPSIPFTLIRPKTVAPLGARDVPATGWGIEAVKAHTSPNGVDGRGVTVAVLDTGINTAHPAFAGLTFSPDDLMDFVPNEEGTPGSATDDDGHGTHVCGTIFGRAVDGTRIGVAPGIDRVIVGRVLGPGGGGTEAIFNAMTWALRRGADIISMSLGIDFPDVVKELVEANYPPEIAASRALEAYRANIRFFDRIAAFLDARGAEGRGVLVIAASGNESQRDRNPRFTVAVAPPAGADGFIAVGAVGRTGNAGAPYRIADFSNTGCLLSGPGEDIVSADFGSNGLVSMDGTSMATPHVAGVAALWTQHLFRARRPTGWANDVRRQLETTTINPSRLTRRDVGLGLVQAPQ